MQLIKLICIVMVFFKSSFSILNCRDMLKESNQTNATSFLMPAVTNTRVG